MKTLVILNLQVVVALAALLSSATADDFTLHSFQRQQLTDVYYSEGANTGDLNGDGRVDVVYGPFWFVGPDFKVKHEIYTPVPQDTNRYADNFFSWVYDFNGDGRNDVFVVGFPGTPAYVYENPGPTGLSSHWKKHQVFDWVSNESPQLTNLTGDERPELVCTRDGFFGFATINWDRPFDAWSFHPISEQITATKFGHGLGIGDVNGDGRLDVIHSKGWFEQPESNAESSRWIPHAASFSNAYGGAEIYAYDVDGDGDNDVITSQAAHDFGLSWYEQVRDGDGVTFKHHLIMGSHPSENKYGVLFSELHSVALADIDGDGLKDIVTGKTYWSHHKQSPMWDAGAVVYWFRLTRTDKGVDWIPYQADGEAGIGRQLSVTDINGDGKLDIIVGGMKGAHVLTHQTKSVPEAEWQAAQPKPYTGLKLPSVESAKAARGPKAKIDEKTGRVEGAIEGESLKSRASAGKPQTQDMSRFKEDRWSDDAQLWWAGGRPGDALTLDLPEFTGTVDLEVVLTCARDYGIVQLSLDDQPLGDPIDLFNPDVITTGVLSFPKLAVKGRKHSLTLQIAGANPQAVKAYMVAIDWLRLRQSDGTFVAGASNVPPDGAASTAVVKQPVPATRETAKILFNGRDLTGWSGHADLWSVEDGELVGRTDGLRRNEWIVSDLSAVNFRLTLEVKLVDNAGNSGIQFRSKAHDGEVSGYQADIGAGWWGKLYEEHGRALLWAKSGEQYVKPGDWNTYEVVADGHYIRTAINGQTCVDLNDPRGATRGIIAFQLHSGGKTEVRFRKIRLELLDDKPEAPTDGKRPE